MNETKYAMLVILTTSILTLLASLLMGLVFSVPMWALWNLCIVNVVPSVLEITWLQAFGISTAIAAIKLMF